MLREHLLVADPVLHRADGAVRERGRGRLDRRGRVHALRRDDPEVAGGQLGGVRRRAELADDLACSGEAQPVLVDRRDVLAVEIEAQTSTSSSCARFAANSDPTAPQPTIVTLTGTTPRDP
jgi:hypothetical protein